MQAAGERRRELGRVASWARLGEEGARRAAARGKLLGQSCWAAWPCAHERAEGRSGKLGLLAPVGLRGGVLGWAPAACWAGAGKEKEGEERECWARPRREGREERRE